MQCILLNSLYKVFSDEAPAAPAFQAASLLRNERFCVQAALFSDKEVSLNAAVEGAFADCCTLYLAQEVPCEMPLYEDSDDYYLRREPGLFPDVLRPLDGAFTLPAGKWTAVWAEIDPKGKLAAGDWDFALTFRENGQEEARCEAKLTIIAADLPAQSLICTNWFHTDCLSDYYKVPVFSEEYWRITENYVRTAVEHGINLILTPLFTPALDTEPGKERPTVQLVDITVTDGAYAFGFEKLTRWLDLCLSCGVEYFELSHLFTQWGAKHAPKIMATVDGETKRIFGWETRAGGRVYTAFLTQFAAALTAYLQEKNLVERCFIHVSDEPSLAQYRSYKKKADLLSRLFPGFRMIDALSDYKFFEKKVVKLPIPAVNHAEDFVGRVPEFWTYYCCGQHKDYVPNRFLAMPAERTRVLGFLLYQSDCKGFLQWGYNFWNTQLSKANLDPFRVTDAGKAFPSGDAFVVYPAQDGTALPSLRLKLSYEAFQDMRALQLLESRIGREATLALLNEGLLHTLTFKDYPRSAAWLAETRERINRRIIQEV